MPFVYPTARCGTSRGWIPGVHAGLDIACACGTQVVAVDAGDVWATAFEAGGYGNWVGLMHGDGLETRYAHLSQIVAVQGAHVAQGELIGLVGNTGGSRGCHLHFEVLISGAKVPPESWVGDAPSNVQPGDGMDGGGGPTLGGGCRLPILGGVRL